MNSYSEDSKNFLFISDLDDTLIGDSEKTRQFIRIINGKRRNFFLVYSSGRFKDSMLSVMEEEGLIEPDAIISNVGTEIHHPPGWNMDEEWKKRISKNWNKELIKEKIEDLPVEEQPYRKKFTASYYVYDESVVSEIRERLSGEPVSIIHTKGENLDIIPENAGKGNAALFLKNRKDLPLICSGDSENDEDMLKISDYGILVGNAVPELKKKFSRYPNIYQSKKTYAAGVIEGLEHYDII